MITGKPLTQIPRTTTYNKVCIGDWFVLRESSDNLLFLTDSGIVDVRGKSVKHIAANTEVYITEFANNMDYVLK